VTPVTNVSEPKIAVPVPAAMFRIGLPELPVKSIDFPSLGMSAVIVCPAVKALGIDTSSCGSGTREVQPCVDQVNDDVPAAVWVAGVVRLVVMRVPLPAQSPTNAEPEFVHEGEPEMVKSSKSTSPLMTTAAPVATIVRAEPG